ncbi:uncharacterized protein LAESUDRAFT_725829 [Laetiporus sulphureus 93-53]|uniref:Uncharacterized protein n=1 Tax=Laetiporus sulphureus 93-53 TaxID=1314785 RepID=A0A165ECR0_9APHY|nr:uncharacterized protein LAESUDRAFT_725829 [Laetiporus sulphureus 93-53]KZT06744.1 hypothetical protein LAESUDRAFT_725829 [Laetiporus sulphureus 93-53]
MDDSVYGILHLLAEGHLIGNLKSIGKRTFVRKVIPEYLVGSYERTRDSTKRHEGGTRKTRSLKSFG